MACHLEVVQSAKMNLLLSFIIIVSVFSLWFLIKFVLRWIVDLGNQILRC
jgi:hypothetical protein